MLRYIRDMVVALFKRESDLVEIPRAVAVKCPEYNVRVHADMPAPELPREPGARHMLKPVPGTEWYTRPLIEPLPPARKRDDLEEMLDRMMRKYTAPKWLDTRKSIPYGDGLTDDERAYVTSDDRYATFTADDTQHIKVRE